MLAPEAKAAPSPRREAILLVEDLADLPLEIFAEGHLEAALRAGLGGQAGGIVWVRHRFAPSGLSLVGLGACYRVALHTWPERRALALDLYGTEPGLELRFARCMSALLGAPSP